MKKEEVLDFLSKYEAANNSHDFKNLENLIHKNAVYFFSDCELYWFNEIKDEINATFNNIKEETYRINNIQIIHLDNSSSTVIYDFIWNGLVDWVKTEWRGRWTNTIIKEDGELYMKHEHLSTK